MTLPSFEGFKTQLQYTLNHFYDPLFHPEEQVFELLRLDLSQGIDTVRQTIRGYIEEMKPEIATPSDTSSYRFYEILKQRYLNSVSQDEAAFQLGMTPRNLRRIQQQAVYALAQKIWAAYSAYERSVQHQPESATPSTNPDPQPILRELEVLQRNSPGAVADLAESFDRIQAISLAAFNDPSIRLEIKKPETQLIVPIHPSVLDQVLLSTLDQLGKMGLMDFIYIEACLQGKTAEIKMTAPFSAPERPYSASPALLEMLNLVGGTQSVAQAAQRLEICFRFPTVPQIHILLIDDNPDFFHLFLRYTRFTRYVIHNISDGSQLQAALAEFHPQIIILDVLLPDIDGWQLLMDLQKPLLGQSIPVIVCTALGQQDLAYSLGAKAYLPKPVTREEFLQTLGKIL